MTDDIQCCAGGSLSEEERAACVSLIREGGAIVNSNTAEARLPQAMLVAINRVGQEIVGVGAIKRSNIQRASSIARDSHFQFDPHSHELGYVAVAKSHRGKKRSRRITEALCSTFQERPLFATTSDEHMKKTLRWAGFVQQDQEWQGNSGQLSFWILNVTPTP